jgi:pimeloyl-ACP methyl ester carboxylesterase
VAFALYPEAGGPVVGTAAAEIVGAQASTLKLAFDASPDVLAYQAEMTSLPVPPLPVAFDGPEQVRSALEAALADDGTVGIVLADRAAATEHAVIVGASAAFVVETASGRRLQGVEIDPADCAADMPRLVTILKTIATWQRGRALDNAATRMDRSRIDMMYVEQRPDGSPHEHPPGIVRLAWDPKGAAVRGRLKLRNRTDQRLNAALVYFSPEYGVVPIYNVALPVGDPMAADGGWMTLMGELPEESFSLGEGVDFSVEIFKVIISTERIDDFLLAQEALTIGKLWGRERSAFNAVKPPEQQKLVHRDEWFALDCVIHVVRKLDVVGPADAVLAGGAITVKAHPSVTATLALSAAAAGTRDAGGTDLPRALAALGMPLLDFGDATRGAGTNVLELTEISGAAELAATPLEIAVKAGLQPGETIVPLVFDGEFMRLGGDTRREAGGVVVSIDGIPEGRDNQRSLLGSLKLYFVRTMLKQENVNLLRRVEVGPDGAVERSKFGVADKVMAAERILLLVHGIIGDTGEMAADVVASGIAAKFDLVLTYDYENLGTLIGDTALALEQALAGVGLGPGDGKSLTILAHSMGGLVARAMIERGGGRATIDHLVMCGTPNGGSPFGKVGGAMAIARMLGDLAANVAPASLPFVAPLRAILKAAGGVTPTLEQMNPASKFLLELNASDDPGVRYTILAGSIDAYAGSQDAYFGRLLTAAGRSAAFDLLFENQPNDIAASVESIKAVGGVRAARPERLDVACHHMNYFSAGAGRAALDAVRW